MGKRNRKLNVLLIRIETYNFSLHSFESLKEKRVRKRSVIDSSIHIG